MSYTEAFIVAEDRLLASQVAIAFSWHIALQLRFLRITAGLTREAIRTGYSIWSTIVIARVKGNTKLILLIVSKPFASRNSLRKLKKNFVFVLI